MNNWANSSSSLAQSYSGLQPRLSETLSYFAETQTPSVEVAAENLGKESGRQQYQHCINIYQLQQERKKNIDIRICHYVRCFL